MAAPGLKLTFDNRDLMRRLNKVEDSVRKDAAAKGLRAAEMHMIGWVKIFMDKVLNRQTGNLIGSIEEEELHLGTKSWITFGPHTVYARIHELGGIIRPTNGPYLVFVGSSGNLVFTKSVTMPARPYLRPAMDEKGDESLKVMGDTIGSVIEGAYR